MEPRKSYLTSFQEFWRKKYHEGNFHVERDMLNLDKSLNNYGIVKKALPRVILGNLYCEDIEDLTQLVGFPMEVHGDCLITNCGITSLIGGPDVVYGDFYCTANKIGSLKHGPRVVKKDYSANNCDLTSIEGIPEKLYRYVYLQDNKLKTLEGFSDLTPDFKKNKNSLSIHGNPKELRIHGDYVLSESYRRNNYWLGLLRYMLKNEIILSVVDWPYDVTDGWPEKYKNQLKSGKSIKRFNL